MPLGHANDDQQVLPFAWLGSVYRARMWWWEGAVFARKLALCAAFDLAAYRSINAVFACLVTLTAALLLQLVARPYGRRADTLAEMCSLFVLQLTVAAGVMGVQHDGALSLVVTVPVLLLNGAAFVGLLALIVRDSMGSMQRNVAAYPHFARRMSLLCCCCAAIRAFRKERTKFKDLELREDVKEVMLAPLLLDETEPGGSE